MIIAEIGINHNGDMSLAKTLINAAANAGADCAKFQAYKSEVWAPPGAKRDMLKKYELSNEHLTYMKQLCDRAEIEFLCTPFDKERADFIDPLVKEFKIGSGQANDLDFLAHVSSKGKPIILSTGMSSFEDIRHSLTVIDVPVTLLHCVSLYPTAPNEAKLGRMVEMQNAFSYQIGYSDHTEGIAISLAAKALGAVVIEKHITLDKAMDGPDHAASITYSELKALVDGCRRIGLSLSD